tara:strand:+ start:131 stop:568 length:438 start_codon:yes stop_codon:yes gene_type:complete
VRLLQAWKGKKIYLVDVWQKTKNKEEAITNLQPYEDKYEIIHNTSMNALEKIPDKSLDFCHIDASHTYENVVDDINGWWEKIIPNGILCGHDYWIDQKNYQEKYNKLWKNTGVKQAVDEFVSKHNLQLHCDPLYKTKPNCWYIKK